MAINTELRADAPPILDISSIYTNDPIAKAKLVENVRRCCLRNGFFQITGHNVPLDLQKQLLRNIKEFFDLPREEKLKVHKDNTTWNRGYESIGSQVFEPGQNPDLKEGFYVGEEITKEHPYFVQKKLNSGPNQWPQAMQNAESFRTTSLEYYSRLHQLARDILKIIALTLDLSEDYFVNFTDGAVATLRFLHYPPQPADSDEKLSRGIGAHTDFGSVTLLLQDEVEGLQVYEKTTNEWLDVKPIEGAYVVNLGNMFMRWSNDKYISNLHRVINKSGYERYSVPFFYSGNPDYTIACLPNCREEGESAKYKPITVMEAITNSYRESYGKATAMNKESSK